MRTAIVSIPEKLNTVQWLNICSSKEVNYLVAELDPQNPHLDAFVQKRITVL